MTPLASIGLEDGGVCVGEHCTMPAERSQVAERLVRLLLLDALAHGAQEVWFHHTFSVQRFRVVYVVRNKTLPALSPPLEVWNRLQDGLQQLASLPVGEAGRQLSGRFELTVSEHPRMVFAVDLHRDPVTGTQVHFRPV